MILFNPNNKSNDVAKSIQFPLNTWTWTESPPSIETNYGSIKNIQLSQNNKSKDVAKPIQFPLFALILYIDNSAPSMQINDGSNGVTKQL